MIGLLASPDAVAPNGVPDADVVKVFRDTKARNNPVAIVSNHGEPPWFQGSFAGSDVQFLQTRGRQNGALIAENAERLSLAPHNFLVLASNADDVAMGKNGGAVLVAAGWSNDPKVRQLSVGVDSPDQLSEVIALTDGWPGGWFFSAQDQAFSLKALADLSSMGYKPVEQQRFGAKLQATVKTGSGNLTALLVTAARSFLADQIDPSSLAWGVYPSSSSSNNDTEVLSDFVHRLRTAVSRVRFAKRGEPLFIRHVNTPPRHRGGGNRLDPRGQIESIHLNPVYEGKLHGRHVIVVDDCTTYGTSFSVAEAFLRAAGADLVTGVAMGKFGNQTHRIPIEIGSNPFRPVAAGQYTVQQPYSFGGTFNNSAQQVLRSLLG